MHLRDQRLTFGAAQQHGSYWLLHATSFATPTIDGRSDQRDGTGAGELGKPHASTTHRADDGMPWWPHGADASLCPMARSERAKGRQAQTARPQGHLAAAA